MNNLLQKLSALQVELKAPKGQYNSFGKYNYRSCEDILEAVKPLCQKHGLVLHISDNLEYIGERYYIKATATILDIDSGNKIENSAFAREEETKKGMDGSQITGTASSYARKYALNGLFCIDDTKDSDTDEYRVTTTPTPPKKAIPAEEQPLVKGNTAETVSVLIKGKYHLIKDMTQKQLEWVMSQADYAPAHFFAQVKAEQGKNK